MHSTCVRIKCTKHSLATSVVVLSRTKGTYESYINTLVHACTLMISLGRSTRAHTALGDSIVCISRTSSYTTHT